MSESGSRWQKPSEISLKPEKVKQKGRDPLKEQANRIIAKNQNYLKKFRGNSTMKT